MTTRRRKATTACMTPPMTRNDLVFEYADRILNAMTVGVNPLNKDQFFYMQIKQKVIRTFQTTAIDNT